MKTLKVLGTSFAAAAVLALAVVPASAIAAHAKKVPCYGVDICKGKKAGCQKKEMVMMTAKMCKKKGGSTTAPAASGATTTAPAETPAS